MGNFDNSYIMIPVGVPIYWFLVMTASFARAKRLVATDTDSAAEPRLAQKVAMSEGTPGADFVRRATAAHQNGWENFTVLISACLAALIGKVDPKFVNIMIVFILVLRFFYNIFYLAVSEGPLSFVRSLAFTISMALVWAIWVKSCIEVM
eukprot:TRINITY_DN1843_c0_g1_i1.p1 TRINITY_DN1843_c0_g1~~TRINITY_DN1843_c0_g1_i1.p1  ORF type:complete len:172 (+),score=23.01 TRINITY_DN1843_c0_g1_i1:68-517(+)